MTNKFIIESATINFVCNDFVLKCGEMVGSTGENINVGDQEQCLCATGYSWDDSTAACSKRVTATIIGLAVALGVVGVATIVLIVLLVKFSKSQSALVGEPSSDTIVVKQYK